MGTMTSAQIDETLFMRFSTTRTRMTQSTTDREDIIGKITATDDGTGSSLGHDERKKNYPTKQTFITYYLYLGNERLLGDRKSTRLNSSHVKISYAVFCLKKKITN